MIYAIFLLIGRTTEGTYLFVSANYVMLSHWQYLQVKLGCEHKGVLPKVLLQVRQVCASM